MAKTLTLKDICELDNKTQERAMVMLSEHKAYSQLLDMIQRQRIDKLLETEKRLHAVNQQLEERNKDLEAKNKDVDQKKKLLEETEKQLKEKEQKLRKAEQTEAETEKKRIAALSWEEKRNERWRMEDPYPSGWTCMDNGISASDAWDDEHDRLNAIYGADTYVVKPPYSISSGEPKPDYRDDPDQFYSHHPEHKALISTFQAKK